MDQQDFQADLGGAVSRVGVLFHAGSVSPAFRFHQLMFGYFNVVIFPPTLCRSKLGTADAVLFYIINVFRNQFEFPNRTNYDQLWILVDFESTVSTENALG